MLLRRLNDLLPALCRGFESPGTEFEPYAAQIAGELEWLRIHPVQIELSGYLRLAMGGGGPLDGIADKYPPRSRSRRF